MQLLQKLIIKNNLQKIILYIFFKRISDKFTPKTFK